MPSQNSQCTCVGGSRHVFVTPAAGEQGQGADLAAGRPSPVVVRHHVSSTDADEASAILTPAYPKTFCTPEPRESFDVRLDIVRAGAVCLVTMAWGGAVRTETCGDEGVFALVVADRGTMELRPRGQRVQIVPAQKAMVCSAGDVGRCRIEAGFQGYTLNFERAVLDSHFEQLTGQALRGPLRFTPELSLAGGAGATLLSLSALYRSELALPGPNPLLLASLRDAILTAMITGLPHSEAASLRARSGRVAPASVRRAEAFMAARAADPITLADIAAAAGTPVRSLQAAFRSARDMTPMEFLRRRRMELARERLLTAAPGMTVVHILRSLGFHHPGHFSTGYRRLFGESPSATLSRAQLDAPQQAQDFTPEASAAPSIGRRSAQRR